MNTISSCHHTKWSLTPLTVALAFALSGSAALAERYEGYTPQQQEAGGLSAGSGYTDTEAARQDVSTPALAPSPSDIAVDHEGQADYPSVMPLAIEGAMEPFALDGTRYQIGSGYTSSTSQDQGELIIVIASNAPMEADQSGSAESQDASLEDTSSGAACD